MPLDRSRGKVRLLPPRSERRPGLLDAPGCRRVTAAGPISGHLGRPLRAAVIGTGRIAGQHLACLERLPDAELVGVCDLSAARAEAVAQRWQVPWYVDHRRLLAEQTPDVVHVTTPPAAHVPLALDALASGAHVFVEKPAAPDVEAVDALLEAARCAGRHLVESYTYVFCEQVQDLLGLRDADRLGEVVHVDVSIALGILEPGSAFVDGDLRHPALDMPGGAISDFLTHLASVAIVFAGPARSVATCWQRRHSTAVDTDDELRVLVDAGDATATLSFSANARPEVFWLRVETTRLRAVANLFETRLTIEPVRPVPRAVGTLVNGFAESRDTASAAVRGLARKLSGGPTTYRGLWTLIEDTYRALLTGREPPVPAALVRTVNELVGQIVDEGRRL